MATPIPWTDDDDTRLKALHAAETSLRTMASDLGRGRSAVDRRMRHLGLTSNRDQTAAATQTRILDAAGRRSALELALLIDAERLRLQMFSPAKAFNFGGKDNTYAEVDLDQPVIADQLKLQQAVGIAITHSLKISDHDADTGVTEAVGMLDQIAAAITAATAGLDEPT